VENGRARKLLWGDDLHQESETDWGHFGVKVTPRTLEVNSGLKIGCQKTVGISERGKRLEKNLKTTEEREISQNEKPELDRFHVVVPEEIEKVPKSQKKRVSRGKNRKKRVV